MAKELLASNQTIDEPTSESFIRDQIQAWSGSLGQIAGVNVTKSRWVRSGQLFLLAGMALISASLFLAVLTQ
jgi:hypothetical protein